MQKTRLVKMLLVAALFWRLGLSLFGTLTLDQNTYIYWARRMVEMGPGQFYDAWCDYLPGYLYILWGLGLLEKLGLFNLVMLYKLPAIISDIASGYLIYRIVLRQRYKKWALFFAAAYLFNPAVIINSTLWGQTDSLVGFSVIASIYLLDKQEKFSAVILAVGTLIKPQTAVIVPVILTKMIVEKWKLMRIVKYGVIGALVFILAFVPFSDGNVIKFMLERVGASLGQYRYTSVNAFNFWGSMGMWESEEWVINKNIIGYIIFIFISIIWGVDSWKKKRYKNQSFYYLAASLSLLSSFIFFTRMHERHMLPVFAPMIVAASGFGGIILGYVILSFTYVANMLYSYVWINNDFREIFKKDFVMLVSMVNVLSLFVFFKGREIGEFAVNLWRNKNKLEFEAKDYSKNVAKRLIILILLFGFFTRVYNLGNPTKEYFDEVYHAFTAREMLQGKPEAWEWWNSAPEGYAYEWTHPPLAKEVMVLSMGILGENAFSWRLPAAILATINIYLVYLISLELFGDRAVAVFAAGAYSLDGLSLVLGRIGMNDTYLLFFILSSYLMFLKDKHLRGAFLLGLALSSKWSTLWFLPILVLSGVLLKKRINMKYLLYVLIPPLIYIGSYVPMFLAGHNWSQFVEVQKQMWWYHTKLVAEHPYTSSWWSWPLMVRPIWLYTSGEIDGWISNIYAMGNPIVFWSGIMAVIYGVYIVVREKSRVLAAVILSYLVFFVPWAVSPRIMFLYHYAPSVPFMAIAIGVALRKIREFVPLFFTLGIILFVFYYPHWIGISVPVSLDSMYYWFISWK